METMELKVLLKYFIHFVCPVSVDQKCLSHDKFYNLLGFMIFSIFVTRFLIFIITFSQWIIPYFFSYSSFSLTHLVPHITMLTLSFSDLQYKCNVFCIYVLPFKSFEDNSLFFFKQMIQQFHERPNHHIAPSSILRSQPHHKSCLSQVNIFYAIMEDN